MSGAVRKDIRTLEAERRDWRRVARLVCGTTSETRRRTLKARRRISAAKWLVSRLYKHRYCDLQLRRESFYPRRHSSVDAQPGPRMALSRVITCVQWARPTMEDVLAWYHALGTHIERQVLSAWEG